MIRIMVKRANDNWEHAPMENASSNTIRKYLEMCKDWYLQNEDSPTNTKTFFNMTQGSTYVYPTSFGLCESELKMIDNFQCFLCEKPVDFKKEGKSFMVNPFTRNQYMITCNDCDK
jgi:hypothetical protein